MVATPISEFDSLEVNIEGIGMGAWIAVLANQSAAKQISVADGSTLGSLFKKSGLLRDTEQHHWEGGTWLFWMSFPVYLISRVCRLGCEHLIPKE